MANKNITIHHDTCTKCAKCARVCPADVINQENKGEPISIKYVESCIGCGHCVDVCPTGSVHHSLFPQEKIHAIDYSQLSTPEQVMLLIKSRRSNRTITSKAIPQTMLDMIVEAAYYAPTASNNQQVSVTVITNPEVLRQVSNQTVNMFDSAIKKLSIPPIKFLLKPFLKELYHSIPAFYRYKQQHMEGGDPILRKATALLVFHTPKASSFGSENANLAYQNASLMAQSLGISQIYMGFVMRAIKQGDSKEFSRILGVSEKIHAIMALGIPAVKYVKYVERG